MSSNPNAVGSVVPPWAGTAAGAFPGYGPEPPAVDYGAGQPGVAPTVSRSDHDHDLAIHGAQHDQGATDPLTTGLPVQIDVGDAQSQGVGPGYALSDHQHALPAPGLPASQVTGAGTAGVSSKVAREDHVHPMAALAPAAHAPTHAPATGTDPLATGIAGSIQPDDTPAVGTADSFARSDHRHGIDAAAPAATGVATASSEGVATSFARSDHAHQSNTAAVQLTAGAAATIGTSGEPARADHKHSVSTAAPGATGVATASAEGTATSFARSDHAHQSNTLPSAQVTGAGSIGTSGEPARADHVHPMAALAPAAHASTHAPQTGSDPLATAAAGTIAVGDTAATGTADSLARSDHRHALPAPAAPANVDKSAASAGVATTVARADHKHDVSTASPGASIDIGDAAAEGVATSLARSDHQHAFPAPVAAPPVVSTAGATGVATTPARSDHTHGHGSQPLGAGTDHAVATTLVAGFMSAADKTKLDGLPSAAADRTIIFLGGASMGAGDTGKHFGAQEGDNGSKLAALSPDNQMASGLAGTVTRLSWNSQTADGTTVFKVNQNGLVVATLTLTGVSGTVAVAGVTCALGDLFAIEYDAGTAPGRTTVQLWAYA